MSRNRWMIYGAYGFTGVLIAEEAVRRGHRPLLSGRSREKLAPIAERLGLKMTEINLNDEGRPQNIPEGIELVLNAAGPFVHTAPILVSACLEAGVDYLDVSGEVMVLEQLFKLDKHAREVEIAIIPGVGFNVVASDCLVRYVAERIARPTHLEIATRWIMDGISPGSTKTMIEGFRWGRLARRGGHLIRINARDGLRQQRFLDGVNTIMAIPLGDLATAYRTTRIPNITTFTALHERTAKVYNITEPFLRRIYGVALFRRMASKWVDMTMSGSEDQQAGKEAPQVWTLVRNEEGAEQQAWLETVDSYQFTAGAAIRSVEKQLSDHHVGVLTPAIAFGADFVLEIPGTRRVDHLDDN